MGQKKKEATKGSSYNVVIQGGVTPQIHGSIPEF